MISREQFVERMHYPFSDGLNDGEIDQFFKAYIFSFAGIINRDKVADLQRSRLSIEIPKGSFDLLSHQLNITLNHRGTYERTEC